MKSLTTFWVDKWLAEPPACLDWLSAHCTGSNVFVILPGLNILIRANYGLREIGFVRKHFLKTNFRHRLLWTSIMLLRLVSSRAAALPQVRLELRGQVAYLSDACVEFDLDKYKVRKHHPLPVPAYVVSSQQALHGTNLASEVCDGQAALVFAEPLLDGAPAGNDVLTNVTHFRAALVRYAAPVSGRESTQTYVERLSVAEGLRPAGYDALLDWLLASPEVEVELTLSHGDLRGANVIVERSGKVTAIDWELASTRCRGHDLMNLVVHPCFHGESAEYETAGPEVLWPLLQDLAEAIGLRNDRPFLEVILAITLLEKLDLYVNSERWRHSVEACLETWEQGLPHVCNALDFRAAR